MNMLFKETRKIIEGFNDGGEVIDKFLKDLDSVNIHLFWHDVVISHVINYISTDESKIYSFIYSIYNALKLDKELFREAKELVNNSDSWILNNDSFDSIAINTFGYRGKYVQTNFLSSLFGKKSFDSFLDTIYLITFVNKLKESEVVEC